MQYNDILSSQRDLDRRLKITRLITRGEEARLLDCATTNSISEDHDVDTAPAFASNCFISLSRTLPAQVYQLSSQAKRIYEAQSSLVSQMLS